MPRQFYTDDDRTMIFVSTIESRRNGLTWAETHTIARKAGFKGGVPALQVFIKNQRKKNKKAMRDADKKVKASMKAVSPEGQIEAEIERIVKERVRAALAKAVAILQAAK